MNLLLQQNAATKDLLNKQSINFLFDMLEKVSIQMESSGFSASGSRRSSTVRHIAHFADTLFLLIELGVLQ